MNEAPRQGSNDMSGSDDSYVVISDPTVSIRIGSETVGDLSNEYTKRKRQSSRRFEFLAVVASMVGSLAVAGVSSASQSLLEGGGSALIAAGAALSGLGLGIGAWTTIRRARETRTPRSPMPPGLAAMGDNLRVMRQPLIERSSLQSSYGLEKGGGSSGDG
jgi:hypothetical protein